MAAIRVGSEAVSLMASQWDKEIKLKASEEAVIYPDFDKGNIETSGDTWYVRVIPAVTVVAPSTTVELGPEDLTYESGAVTRVSASPIAAYGAVEIGRNVFSRLTSADGAATRAAYRTQIRATLDQKIDVEAGNMATAISTTLGPGNFDKAALLYAKRRLRTAAKSHYKNGSMVHLKYHPSQIDQVESIAEIMNANLRGDASNPNVKGVVVNAWGMTLAETGNIPFSAGSYYNLLHLKPAFAFAFNEEPGVEPVQRAGLAERFIGYTDFAIVEVFDEDAVVQLTA